MSSWTKTRSTLALTIKKNPNADVTELRRQLKAERLADYVERKLAEAPPITAAQRDRIAVLLRGGSPPGSSTATQPDLGANQEGHGGDRDAA